MIRVARMPTQTLRQTVIVEKIANLEHGARNPVQLINEPKAHHAHRKGSMLDRPDRAPMIAVRIAGCLEDRVRTPQPLNMSSRRRRRATDAARSLCTMPHANRCPGFEVMDLI